MPDLKGSPPLTRGIPGNIKTLGGATRFTPAHAGNTLPHLPDRRLSQVHPRSRGEYKKHCWERRSRSGSPPLTRGILKKKAIERIPYRFTPAHAGNTNLFRWPVYFPEVHPRSRGEYVIKGTALERRLGSPPLTRGIRVKQLIRAKGDRFTPAHAGNTNSNISG